MLAIIKGFKKKIEINISFADILRGYQIICENYGLHPRSNSQLWNYLQEFKREGIISIEILGEKIRGRKASIQIPEIDLLKLEKIVVDILQSKGLSV